MLAINLILAFILVSKSGVMTTFTSRFVSYNILSFMLPFLSSCRAFVRSREILLGLAECVVTCLTHLQK